MRGLQTNGISWQGTASQPDLSEGLCASGRYPPDTWFPAEQYGQRAAEEDAAYLCLSCPVLEPCLTYVASRCEPDGVWAGTVPRERKAARSRAWRARLSGADFQEAVARDLREAVRRRGGAVVGTGSLRINGGEDYGPDTQK